MVVVEWELLQQAQAIRMLDFNLNKQEKGKKIKIKRLKSKLSDGK